MDKTLPSSLVLQRRLNYRLTSVLQPCFLGCCCSYSCSWYSCKSPVRSVGCTDGSRGLHTARHKQRVSPLILNRMIDDLYGIGPELAAGTVVQLITTRERASMR